MDFMFEDSFGNPLCHHLDRLVLIHIPTDVCPCWVAQMWWRQNGFIRIVVGPLPRMLNPLVSKTLQMSWWSLAWVPGDLAGFIHIHSNDLVMCFQLPLPPCSPSVPLTLLALQYVIPLYAVSASAKQKWQWYPPHRIVGRRKWTASCKIFQTVPGT